jgi:hypothetical protein
MLKIAPSTRCGMSACSLDTGSRLRLIRSTNDLTFEYGIDKGAGGVPVYIYRKKER